MLTRISRTANFRPGDTADRILEDLACPACGYQDLGNAHNRLAKNELRIFCEGCGAFITVAMSDDQASTIHAWSISGSDSALLGP